VSTLTITRGLPGSGKTTYAKTWVSEDVLHRSRLNRDDFREMLHGGPHGYDRPLEQAVTWAHQGAVRCLLAAGRDVICDDMNLQNRQVKEWMKLAKEAGADFEVVDLTNVPVGTCIDRDKSRFLQGGRHVGEEYITKKHQQFIKGRQYPLPLPELSVGQYVEPYVAPKDKPKCILVDIDGTMALMNGRGPYDWHRVGEDKPNTPIHFLVDLLEMGFEDRWDGNEWRPEPIVEIVFLSGRDEVCRPETESWLAGHGYGNHKLFMRPSLPDGVQQPADNIVKLALFDEHIRHNYNVQFVLDDRDQVVEMWRSLGLTCLQVNYGNF
jgi:predicted kinase